jgi:hypothetical protein
MNIVDLGKPHESREPRDAVRAFVRRKEHRYRPALARLSAGKACDHRVGCMTAKNAAIESGQTSRGRGGHESRKLGKDVHGATLPIAGAADRVAGIVMSANARRGPRPAL